MAARTPINPLGLEDTSVVRVVEVVEQDLVSIEADEIFSTAASSVIEEAFRVIGVNENDNTLGRDEVRKVVYRFMYEGDLFDVTVVVRNVE